MGECKQGLCTLCVLLLVGSKIHGELITAVDVRRGVVNMEKYRWGTWSMQ
jgi:hypothetical protein